MKALILTLILSLTSTAGFAEDTVLEAEIPTVTEATNEAAIPLKETKKEITATTAVSETDIPVVLESAHKADAGSNSATKILLTISIAAVLGAALFYYIRKNAKGSAKSEATQIKVLTQQFLGPKKHLAIIRVAGESILIGITDHSINHIKTLSLLDDDIPENVPASFKLKNPEIADEERETEEFSMAGIRDVVSSKLKNMRSLE